MSQVSRWMLPTMIVAAVVSGLQAPVAGQRPYYMTPQPGSVGGGEFRAQGRIRGIAKNALHSVNSGGLSISPIVSTGACSAQASMCVQVRAYRKSTVTPNSSRISRARPVLSGVR